jgi:protein tyrosine/serine phosphatase
MPKSTVRYRRLLKGSVVSVSIIAVVTLGHLGLLQVNGNIHTVAADRCYRSAQLGPEKLHEVVDRYHIKSILNLRGANPGNVWYDQEIQESRELGVAHFDFGMSARKELTFAEAQSLIALMKSAPKPLLIHCKAGADRSGLASALYLAAVEQAGEIAAERQLSIRYGHIGVPMLPWYAMEDTFEMMEPSLGYEGS